MGKKAYIILLIILVAVFFISGCTSIKTSNNNASLSFTSQEESDLMDKLTTNVTDYKADYKTKEEIHFWSGHSGATDFIEESNISIEASNGKIINYNISYNSQDDFNSVNYYKYFDATKNKLCKEEIVSESECDPADLIPPNLGSTLNGCKMTFSKDGEDECICNGNLYPIDDLSGFACSQNKNTSDMKLMYGHGVYYPETKKGFCYYDAQDNTSKEFWAFECNKKINLEPLISTNLTPLSNIGCYEYGGTCDCTFNPVKTLNCSDDKPDNFDTNTKKRIIDFLKNPTSLGTNITHENIKYKDCYEYLFSNLEQTFCFDNNNLITFAQWGENISDYRHTNIDINNVEKVSSLVVNNNQ